MSLPAVPDRGPEHSPDDELRFSEQDIAERTGFRLGVYYPEWETDAAGIIQFGEDINYYGREHGYTNVIGSLFVHEGKLTLGIFIKGNVTAIETNAYEVKGALDQPQAELE